MNEAGTGSLATSTLNQHSFIGYKHSLAGIPRKVMRVST